VSDAWDKPEVTKRFRGRSMEGVMVVRDEDVGLCKITKRQKDSVRISTALTDNIELRENQADTMFQKAFSSLLSSSSDAGHEFVLCDGPQSADASSSSAKRCTVLLNTKSLLGNADSSTGGDLTYVNVVWVWTWYRYCEESMIAIVCNRMQYCVPVDT